MTKITHGLEGGRRGKKERGGGEFLFSLKGGKSGKR